MEITINGTQKEIDKSLSLKNLIEQFCKDSSHVVAELNGSIIKKNAWDKLAVSEGDSLELVSFVGGG